MAASPDRGERGRISQKEGDMDPDRLAARSEAGDPAAAGSESGSILVNLKRG